MIHVKVWSGSRSATITDMTNAGKRGKLCRILRVSGTPWHGGANLTPEQKHILDWSDRLLFACLALAPGADAEGRLVFDADFDAATAPIRAVVASARVFSVPEWACAAYDETIKGIRAPRPRLSAGVQGKWSAGADETGISLRRHDDINEWSEITPHDQTGPRAYEIAAKVWDRVKLAKSMHEATDILRMAGAKLHGYCAMD